MYFVYPSEKNYKLILDDFNDDLAKKEGKNT